MEAYRDYPLHKWFSNGKYNLKASKKIMESSLKGMVKDGLIYADSENLNGFAALLPLGFVGSEAISFLFNGGLELILSEIPTIIKKTHFI